MKYRQIGNGDALSLNTNTSFLVDVTPKNSSFPQQYLLVDCGRNILNGLVCISYDILKYIDFVYITSIADDTIGSLATLISYRYKMYGKETTIFTESNKTNDLSSMLKYAKYEYKDSCVENTNAWNIETIYARGEGKYINASFTISCFSSNSPIRDTCGCVIKETSLKNKSSYFIYTGSSKAQMRILDTILSRIGAETYEEAMDKANIVVFHTVAMENTPTRLEIACENDLVTAYPSAFKDNIKHCYNNTTNYYKDEWVNIDE